MPFLPVYQPHVKQLYLPSTANLPQDQQAWVKLDVSPLTTADTMVYKDVDNNTNVRFARLLAKRITEWNFIDEATNQVADITFETICRLPKVDYDYLSKQDLDNAPDVLSATEKKSSSSTLTPSTT